jgi:hypothetical protein
VESLFRRRAPTLARLFEAKTRATDRLVFVAFTSLASTWLVLAPPVVRGAGGWASVVLTAVQVGVFTWALGAVLRAATGRRLDASAESLAATLVAAYLILDRIVFGITGAHARPAAIREAYEAVRAGALTPGAGGVASGVLGVLALWLVLTVALKALAFLPPLPRADAGIRRAAVPALLAAGTAASLRACLFTGGGARDVERAVPWEPEPAVQAVTAQGADGGDRTAALLGERRVLDLLEARRAVILSHPIRAASRPDILIIHAESLRADMLRPDVAPSMVALAKESLSPPHHLTTGTNTGTGVFGLLHGMLSPYYPLARRDHLRPLPLEILKALGYRVSAYFANNFRVYDGLYDLFFAGLADFSYEGPQEPVYAADAQMVDAYLATLRAAPPDGPARFDYVVLDSTHYDYSYPPSFERFTPAMTLDLGIKDGLIIREGINDELRPRAPYVRNRYQNSILYVDSLVQRIVDALRETHRLEHTVVVVTGDHGEEFWESGVFGHGYGHLSKQQCEVPLVMRLPGGDRSTRYTYSSHADVFPTLFDVMGLETEGGAFMNGKSLLRYDPALDVAVSGYGVTGDKVDERLLVEGDGMAVHWIDAPPFRVTEVTAVDGAPLAEAPGARADDLVFRAIAAKGLR